MVPADSVAEGLTAAEALARLARSGPNVLPTAGPRSTWAILFDVVREPMFLLLLACGALYVVLGDIHDALMLIGFVDRGDCHHPGPATAHRAGARGPARPVEPAGAGGPRRRSHPDRRT
jgi:hypothetical protein